MRNSVTMERQLSRLAVHSDGCEDREARTWVLVIHYAFENCTTLQPRDFNHMDLKRLHDTFSSYSNCTYKELESPARKSIPFHLSDAGIEELFPTEKDSSPTIFMLFILSHGGANGVIYTDKNDCESFTSSEVLKHLSTNTVLEQSLKMIFLEPCKGDNVEIHMPPLLGVTNVSPDSIKVLAEPTKKNFVIFNASIESTVACAYSDKGTWLVIALCETLETLKEDVTLLEFFRRIARSISSMGFKDNYQMPQFSVFPHENTIFCKKNSVVRRESSKGKDGIAVNAFDTFSWRSESGLIFKRGPALLFARSSSSFPEKLYEVLHHLKFQTEFVDLSQIEETLEYISSNGMTEREGSLLVIVMCSLQVQTDPQTNQPKRDQPEVVINVNGKQLRIGALARKFISTNCPSFAMKPKVFILIDPQTATESAMRVTIPTMNDASQRLNHEDILILTCFGRVSMGKLIDGLELMRQKKISTLQQVLLDTINANSQKDHVGQLWSTMTKKLSFPEDVDVYRPHCLVHETNEKIEFQAFVNKFLRSSITLVLIHSDANLGKSRFADEIHTQLVIKFRGTVVLAKLNERPEFLTKCVATVAAFLKQFADVRSEGFEVREKKLCVIVDEWSELLDGQKKSFLVDYLPLFIKANARVLIMIQSRDMAQLKDMLDLHSAKAETFCLCSASNNSEVQSGNDPQQNVQSFSKTTLKDSCSHSNPSPNPKIHLVEVHGILSHDAQVTWMNGCLLAQGSCINLSKLMDIILREWLKVKQIVLCASRRIYIDHDLNLKHTHLVLMAPTIEIDVPAKNKSRTIRMRGEHGKQHAVQPQPSASPDAPGVAGLDGNQGFSSGSFCLVALRLFHPQRLIIQSNGGKGANGQKGGNGWSVRQKSPFPVLKIPTSAPISAPVDFVRAICKTQRYAVTISNKVFQPLDNGKNTLKFDAELKIFPEKRPTDGGRGGAGGSGAVAGDVKLIVQSETDLVDVKVSTGTGEGGKPGKGGQAGRTVPGKFRKYRCGFESSSHVDYKSKSEIITGEGECESFHQSAQDGKEGPKAAQDTHPRYKYMDGLLQLDQSFIGAERFEKDQNSLEFIKFVATSFNLIVN